MSASLPHYTGLSVAPSNAWMTPEGALTHRLEQIGDRINRELGIPERQVYLALHVRPIEPTDQGEGSWAWLKKTSPDLAIAIRKWVRDEAIRLRGTGVETYSHHTLVKRCRFEAQLPDDGKRRFLIPDHVADDLWLDILSTDGGTRIPFGFTRFSALDNRRRLEQLEARLAYARAAGMDPWRIYREDPTCDPSVF